MQSIVFIRPSNTQLKDTSEIAAPNYKGVIPVIEVSVQQFDIYVDSISG